MLKVCYRPFECYGKIDSFFKPVMGRPRKRKAAAPEAPDKDEEFVPEAEEGQDSGQDSDSGTEGEGGPIVKCNPLTFDPTVRGSKDKSLLNTSKSRHGMRLLVCYMCVCTCPTPLFLVSQR